MKTLMFMTMACCGALAQAKTVEKPQARPAALTAEEMKAEMDDFLRRTGGKIEKPGSRQGEVVFVNCQTAAKAEWLAFGADYLSQESKFTVSVRTGKFDLAKPEIQGTVSIFVVDSPTYPTFLVAPENRWAMVNVAPLRSDKPVFFEARVKKELSRAFAYLCGAASSQYSNTLLGGVTGVEALDRRADHRLPIDVLARFPKAMAEFGLKPARYMSYANACRQGWAPQPTNEFQKAIWDKVHEIPSKPIKIEYNEKRDKGK